MIEPRIVGRVGLCTMRAPPVNAIDEAFMASFHAALDQVEVAGVHVLVIGSGLRVFCAGAHLARIQGFFADADGPSRMVEYVSDFHRLFDRIESLPCVTLAAINGAAMGGGLELALSCDLRIAADTAQLGLPEARVGMIPGAGGTQRLTRLCGPGVASQMILAAEMVSGPRALAAGLVQWLSDPAELDEKSREIAERIAGLSRNALVAAKDCIRAYHSPHVDGFARELEKPLQLMKDPEARRRIADFFGRA
jgi:enoyl-CoA hydratase/carnithine racemase